METAKKIIESYKKWATKNPDKNSFIWGFCLGFIIGCILC